MIRLLTSLALVVCLSSTALGWGTGATHSSIGWKAGLRDGMPGETQSRFFWWGNNQPDMFLLTFLDYSHDIRFAEILVDVALRTSNRFNTALAYSYGSHIRADWVGHTYYVTEGGIDGVLKEAGVSSILMYSEDPQEAQVAREATVVFNPWLLNRASAEYVNTYGGERVISVFEAQFTGLLMTLGLEVARIIEGSPWFYMYAEENYPRTEWEEYYVQSADSVEAWVERVAPGTDRFRPIIPRSPEAPFALGEWSSGRSDYFMLLAAVGTQAQQRGLIKVTKSREGEILTYSAQTLDETGVESLFWESVEADPELAAHPEILRLKESYLDYLDSH